MFHQRPSLVHHPTFSASPRFSQVSLLSFPISSKLRYSNHEPFQGDLKASSFILHKAGNVKPRITVWTWPPGCAPLRRLEVADDKGEPARGCGCCSVLSPTLYLKGIYIQEGSKLQSSKHWAIYPAVATSSRKLQSSAS